MPNPDHTRRDQHSQHPVDDATHGVCGDHHAAAGYTVGDHTADQEQAHQRKAVGRQDQTDVARVTGQPSHVQADRHQYQTVAEHAHGLPQPQQPEVPRPQSGQHHFTLRRLSPGFS
jgi:hypothetical protein